MLNRLDYVFSKYTTVSGKPLIVLSGVTSDGLCDTTFAIHPGLGLAN